LSKEEKRALEGFASSDNFRPADSVKKKIFQKFRSYFD
jgi:molecular chaperone DnaJ